MRVVHLPGTIYLQTSINASDSRPAAYPYQIDHTGQETMDRALRYLGAAPDARYRVLLHGPEGNPRWLCLSSTLRQQDVTNGMSIIVIAPSEERPSPPAAAPRPAPLPRPPGMQAHRVVPRRVDPHRSPDTGASRPSRRSTYLETISAPGSMDPSAFYVDLSDYERIRRLGKGAFGVVYSAREKRTQLIVAVKERDCDVQDETMKKLFEREVQILGSVRHPALLSLHGCTPFVEHPDHMPAILTPFMANGSLEDIMKKERSGNAPAEWTMTRKLIVLLGIASGMMFMHENRYIHRDLKPGNVLIDEHFEPKIGDFGLSKFVPSGQTLYQSMHDGTPHFMAPEI